ncbi:MAG: hypothetical protein JWR67_613 [Mucilaginibacter sp.]|nr:hypothetical protein [Mucilaginibacter sp.]
MINKKYILSIFLLFEAISSKAQLEYNFSKLAIGFGMSSIRGYTNLNKQDDHFAENINLTYFYSPYVPIAVELQSGTLSGGSIITDKDKRQYTNNYKALIFHGDLQLGQIVDYQYNGFLNFAKNFYVGSGFGFIQNNNKVQRYSLNDPTYPFPGKDNSIDFMVPLRVGYEIKFYNFFHEPFMMIDIGYVHNIAFGEGLDGYNDSSARFRNNAPDQYRQISVGVKFAFGNRTSYTKLE